MPKSRGTVLLVTHVKDERAIYGAALRAHGFHVLLAGSANQAVDVLIGRRADVVVMRIPQPGCGRTGLDLLHRVKQLPSASRVPVLCLTSLTQSDIRAQALAAGCDSYLLLPTLPDRLVAEVVRLNGTRAEVPKAQEEPPSARATIH